MKIYFTVSIDTECDKRADWSVRYPFQFTNILVGLPNHLHPLFKEFSVRPTYLLSPEIIHDAGCVNYFNGLSQIELGTHLHAEYVDPDSDWSATHTARFQCDDPAEVEAAKLTALTNLFTRQFQQKPTSFRAGRFGIGPYTMQALTSLGYNADSSVLPLRVISTRTRTINFYPFPRNPYFPNFGDMRKKGKQRNLIEVPVTVRSPLLEKLPTTWRRFWGNGYANAILRRIFGRDAVRGITLRPSSGDCSQLATLVRERPAQASEVPLYFNMMFHSNEFMAGCSPYAADQRGVTQLSDRVRCVLELLARINVSNITLRDVHTTMVATENQKRTAK